MPFITPTPFIGLTWPQKCDDFIFQLNILSFELLKFHNTPFMSDKKFNNIVINFHRI